MYRPRVRLVNPAQIFILILAFGCEDPAPVADLCRHVRRTPQTIDAIEISTSGVLTKHGKCISGNCRWVLEGAELRREDGELILVRPGLPQKRYPYLEAPKVAHTRLAMIRLAGPKWALLDARDWSERTVEVNARPHELLGLAVTDGALVITGRHRTLPVRQGRITEAGEVSFTSTVLLPMDINVHATERTVTWPGGHREVLNLPNDIRSASVLDAKSLVLADLSGRIFHKVRGAPIAEVPFECDQRLLLSPGLSIIVDGDHIDRLEGTGRVPWRDASHYVDGSKMPAGARRVDLRLVANQRHRSAAMVEVIEFESCARHARIYRFDDQGVRFVLETPGRVMRPSLDSLGVFHAVLTDDHFVSL